MPPTRRIYGLSRFGGVSVEECGILVPFRGSFIAVKIPNMAADPVEDFAIWEMDVEAMRKRGFVVMGFLHTHLEHHPGVPSEGDLAGAELSPDMLHVMYKPSTGDLVWF